jgi:glucokinase
LSFLAHFKEGCRLLSLGVDIGGTKVLAGAVSEIGQVVAERRVASPAQNPDQMVETVAGLIEQLIEEVGSVPTIGIAAAGFINLERSTVLYSPNLNWRNEPLQQRISQRLGQEVIIENDANAAGWAEFRFGAAKSFQSMVMLTLGTGVGGAVVDGGRLLRGGFGIGGELGHISIVQDGIPCGCGRKGCLEQYASGTALLRSANELADSPSPLGKRLRELRLETGQLSGEKAYQAVLEKDPGTLHLVDVAAKHLLSAMSSLVAVLDPEVFVIGGGLSELGDVLIAPLQEGLPGQLPAAGFRPVASVVRAEFSNYAGVIGAAELARQSMSKL